MMIPLRDGLFINPDFIESYQGKEVTMSSGEVHSLTMMEMQSVLAVLRNKGSVETQVAY